MDSPGVQRVIDYFLFTVEPFHNLRLRVFVLVEELAVSYLLSDGLRTGGGQRAENSSAKI